MQLRISLDALQAGDRVRFVVHAHNLGEEIIRLPVGERDRVQVSVMQNDAELWRWTVPIRRGPHGDTTILPNGQVRWYCEWPDPEFGTYTAVASVETGEASCETDSPVVVTKQVAEAAQRGVPSDEAPTRDPQV